MEIKCQLGATDDFYCRSYCLLNMFLAPLCPSSGAREYYTSGCCLSYLVLWFSSCRYGVELRVMCPVCGLLPTNRTMHGQNHIKYKKHLPFIDFLPPFRTAPQPVWCNNKDVTCRSPRSVHLCCTRPYSN